MKKTLSIILSILSLVFAVVLLQSCSKTSQASLNESNLNEYVTKGISLYENQENIDVISGEYVALYNNTDLTDGIYYCAQAKVNKIITSGEEQITVKVDAVIYFVYYINAKCPYPSGVSSDGEYKTVYETALAKLNQENPLNGKTGTF